jgi:type IV secretory pathway VirB10-like protein
MQKIIETIFNVTIILIVALVGTAIGYYSAGYLPKRDAAVETSASAAQAKAEPVRPAAPPAQPPMPMQKEPLALAGPLGQTLIPPPPPQPETVALADRGQPVLRAEPPARKLTMQARYNSCLQQAEHTFTVAWDASCKTSEAERQKNYQRCLTTRGLSKAACERAHKHVPEKNCKLPASLSDRLSAQLQSRAGQCLQEFRAAAG